MLLPIRTLSGRRLGEEYEGLCGRCGSTFVFKRHEAMYWSNGRTEAGLKISCPTCHRDYFTADL